MFRETSLIAFAGALLCGLPVALAGEAAVAHHLPFPAGQAYQVSQGNDQGPTHNDKYNRNAFDFSPMPIGSTVVATAPGVVTFVRETTEGPTGNWKDNNIVAVQHVDGTVGVYEHLAKDGAAVDVGDDVMTGDVIGFSGNSGATNVPHLHFSLRKDRHGGESVPCRFVDVADGGVPKAGDRVSSRNEAMRDSVALRRLRGSLTRYDFAVTTGCTEAGLDDLHTANALDLAGPQAELAAARAHLDAVVKLRTDRAADLVRHIASLRESGDAAAAVAAATLGAKDYMGTDSLGEIKRSLRALQSEPAFADASKALKPMLKYRRVIAGALKAQAKADAALAAIKPGKKPPSRPYRHAISGFERALEIAAESRKPILETHIAALRAR